MAFIQVIELVCKRPEELEALAEEWMAATEGRRTARRSTITADRDRPDTYVQLVEFDSYESAMANSNLSETAAFAQRMTGLLEAPPVFRNLDVRRVDEM